MYQNDDKSSYEYHYSYRSDSEGFRPDQTPAPMELQKPKRGRAKRVAAGILCGVLLVGGSVGAGWLLKDRLDAALAYWEEHPDMKIIVTGGKGDDEHISEAQGMYDYLTAHGVDGAQIFMEDKSRNTWQNINNTFALMEREGWSLTGDVLLVSSGFHLARIEMLWDRVRAGILRGEEYNDQHISTLAAPVSHAPSAVQMFFREPLALVKSFLFDR